VAVTSARTAVGSTRADIQRWELNLQKRTACCEKVGFRQLRPMQARLNVKPLAEDIAKRIVEGQKDERVKWNTDGTVRVIVAKVIPEEHTFKQTLTSRRKRFRLALEAVLGPLGWQQIRRDTYKKAEEVRS
jgi:hypothetical protein